MYYLKHYFRSAFVSIICLGWISMGCHRPIIAVQTKPEVDVVEQIVVPPLVMPSDTNNWVYDGLKNKEAVYQFYNSHHFEMTWLRDSLATLADSMLFFLKSVRLNGLLAQDYHTPEIEGLNAKSIEGTFKLRKEALLTDAFLRLAIDLRFGRLDSNAIPNNIDSLTLQILEQALIHGEIKKAFENQEPDHPGYQLLKKSLKEILNAADTTTRALLFSGVTYDSSALHKQVQAIEINMERWRLELSTFGDRYIWINIPSYQLQVVDRGQIILQSRIIVGTPETPSPTLTSLVECITLYPYWHVPRKIATEEFLPLIQENTSFLTLNNFDVLDRKGSVLNPDSLDWRKYNKNYFPFSLRQREGKANSLGLIKFVFDNPFAVFLHDTNAKGLFRRRIRALSHGCIRMEKALELAKYLLPEPDKVDKMLESKARRTINLNNPIPIYIRYLTSEFANGTLNFYDDIYRRDEEIIQLLYDRPQVAGF